MKITSEMKASVKRVRAENDFPADFKWWERGHELYMRLDDKTVYAIHTNGLVTVHKIGA